jgi:DNA-binding NtrC family response regulator
MRLITEYETPPCAQTACVWRADRRIPQHAARLRAGRASQLTHLSDLNSWRERDGEKAGSAFRRRRPQRLPENNELMPLKEIERRAIFQALREICGDKLAAARLLGIGKTTLYRKLKQYSIDSSQFQALSVSKELPCMAPFLICMSTQCRSVLDLWENRE